MNVSMAATNTMTIEFFGKTAHAGNEPWKGRSALDLLTDAQLRVAARADFDRRKGDYTYKSPLPAKQKHPLGLKLSNDGSVEALVGLSKTG